MASSLSEAGDKERESAFEALMARVEQAVLPLVPSEMSKWELRSGAIHRAYQKGQHLLRAGDDANEVFFIHKGLIRYYFHDPVDDGQERTGQFFDEGTVVTDAESFLTQSAAVQSFEALELSSIVALPRSVLYAAYDLDHAMERFGRLMLEEALIGSQRRASRLLTLQPEERYKTFVRTRPEVARRVPQYLIASYLGLTPESLSRIRRRIAKR